MCPANNPYNGGNMRNPFGVPQNRPNTGSNNTASYTQSTNTKSTASYNPYAQAEANNAPKSQSEYLRQKVATASKGELTLMLFEGCCKFLKRAEAAFETREKSKDPKERIAQIEIINTNIVKAENIIMELMTSLNFDYDISHKLYPVYNYLYRELLRINFEKDGKSLSAVTEVMEWYYDVWKEVVKKDRQNQYSQGTNGSFA